MKLLKFSFLLVASLTLSNILYSQDSLLLDSLPKTKDEFVKSEKAVINTIDWLENTPLKEQKEKRTQLATLLSAWLVNSPTVTILMNAKILTFTKANSSLLIIFMGGWTKYCLQNSYSSDTVKCALAGIESAIKVYKSGSGIKKDSEMKKLIAMQEKGELENWIRNQFKVK